MNRIRNALEILGYVSTVIVLISSGVALSLWLRGIAPVLWRLGNGLSRRKIAIFAKGNVAGSLESLLHDSQLFDRTNILMVSTEGDFGKAEQATLLLVYWPDWKGDLQRILARKRDATAVIVYAPQDQGIMPASDLVLLNKERNVMVTNFRGRLLNDLVTSMITTSYEKN